MKSIAVVVRGSPLNSAKSGEALRMSLGLTLQENRVRVFFVGEGVYCLLPLSPKMVGMREFSEFLQALIDLEVPLIAEAEAIDEAGLKQLAFHPQLLSRDEIGRLLTEHWLVIGC